jgi:hypothetical protein
MSEFWQGVQGDAGEPKMQKGRQKCRKAGKLLPAFLPLTCALAGAVSRRT